MYEFEIEFSSGRWIQERKEKLYYKSQNIRTRRISRCICAAAFCTAVYIGLNAANLWFVQFIGVEYPKQGYYMTIMVLCVAVCVVSLYIFINSIGQLQFHFPGTKLDYEGHFETDIYRILFTNYGFTVWKNGSATNLKYYNIHHIYKDKRGLLLADIDLYIPLEIITKTQKKKLINKFYRQRRKH